MVPSRRPAVQPNQMTTIDQRGTPKYRSARWFNENKPSIGARITYARSPWVSGRYYAVASVHNDTATAKAMSAMNIRESIIPAQGNV